MLSGKSIYHVEQGIGKVIDQGGYYNDLTQKVLMGDSNLGNDGIPLLEHSDGTRVQMPTMIFQYGLGAFDLWLINKEIYYIEIVKKCADWACEHQEENGAWNNFFYIYPAHPYCAMAQGEGASLLIRAYIASHDNHYLIAARKSLQFMLKDKKDGGVTEYCGKDTYLLEYTHLPLVLNGWIFALWGLADYLKVDNNEQFSESYKKTVNTLINNLDKFVFRIWSKYDVNGMIASPFYHHLHIAQMQAMYLLTGEIVFKTYADKWAKQEQNLFCKGLAFIIKTFQKIAEKE